MLHHESKHATGDLNRWFTPRAERSLRSRGVWGRVAFVVGVRQRPHQPALLPHPNPLPLGEGAIRLNPYSSSSPDWRAAITFLASWGGTGS